MVIKKLIYLLVVMLPGLNTMVTAQGSFWKTANAYLGEKPPLDTPQLFAPGRLTGKDEFSIDRVAFSPDGKEIYYCTNTSWFQMKDLKVKYFKYDGKKWIGPQVLNAGFSAPTFSPDYKTLCFTGGGFGMVWRSHKADTGWSAPELYLKRNYEVYDFMSTAGGHKYVGSNGTWGKARDYNSWRFSIMPADDADTTIQDLGSPLNSPGFNGNFFIAKDESYMIISAKEKPDFECELYISFRKPDKTWTEPKSLGPLINNGNAHRFGASVSPDGKYLFYTHGTSAKDCAIYWVRFDALLKKLKKESLGDQAD